MTQEEFDSLVQRVTNALQGSSKMATDLRVVKSPIGVNLLPGVLSGELVALEAASLMGTDGKTPLFEVGTISSGLEADASITLSGTDPSGNPIYKIGLVLPKGDAGKNPILEFEGISTGEPDTDATASFKENGTTEDGRPKYKLSLTIPQGSKGDKGNDGKTPIMEAGSVSKGLEPSVSIIPNGDDPLGNPKYKIDLVLPQGDAGKNPVLEFSEIVTGAAGSEASAVFIPVGQTPEGNPKYLLKLTIPRGDPGLPGTGSGNVSVNGSDLIRGKQYLFVPSSDGSTEGSFVEYIPFNDAELREEIGRSLQLAKTYTNEQIAGIVQFDIQVVSALPETGMKGVIYLVPKTNTQTDAHNEYIWIADQSKYELIGTTAVDLSNYYTKDEANARYILKETNKRLMTDAEGTKLEGIESGANKFQYPDNPVVGQVLSWGDNGALWAETSSGQESFIIGDITRFKLLTVAANPDEFATLLNGLTMDDFDRAVQENIPIFSWLRLATQAKWAYARGTSLKRYADGTTIHYYVTFMVTHDTGNNLGVTTYLLDLIGILNEGWRSALMRGVLIGGQHYWNSANDAISCRGGYTEVYLSGSSPASTEISLMSQTFYPLQNSVTTAMIRNIGSGNKTFTLKLDSTATVDNSKLIVVGEYPELEPDFACEVNILWANWRYIARISEPFDYSKYVE